MSGFTDSQRFSEYRKSIQILAKGRVDFEFGNSSSAHAAVVLANILTYNEEVVIYDTHLQGDIAYQHPDFLNALETFLKKGKSLKIVLKDHSHLADSGLYRWINNVCKPNGCDNLDIRFVSEKFFKVANDEVAKHFNDEGESFTDTNFAIGDQGSYRVELYNGRYGRFHHARCNFNGKKIAEPLLKKFTEGFKDCYPLVA